MKLFFILISASINFFVLFFIGANLGLQEKKIPLNIFIKNVNSFNSLSNISVKQEKKTQVLENNELASSILSDEVVSLNSINAVASYDDLKKFLLELPKIIYPIASIKNKEEGTVRIFLSLNKEIKASQFKIIKSSGYKSLDNTAFLAIKQIKLRENLNEDSFPKVFLIDIVFSL